MKKRTVSVLLILLLVFSLCPFQSQSANALGSVWIKAFYKDKFGDNTEDYYIVNKSPFKGTFSNAENNKGKLKAEIEITFVDAYIRLYENSSNPVKNTESKDHNYNIEIKDKEGTVYKVLGFMAAGSDKITINHSYIDTMIEPLANSKTVTFYVEKKGTVNNYVFQVECDNFNKIYQQEIITPMCESLYQRAIQYFQANKYEEAIEIFETLKPYDYKDSTIKLEEAIEGKNEKEYQKAESLLKQQKYDEAIKIFESLGAFKDSRKRASEAKEVRDRDIYSAESTSKIVTFGKYDQDNNASNGKEPIEWIVLNTGGSKSLLISKYILDGEQMFLAYHKSITDYKYDWGMSSLRRWLNDTFLNEAFSANEQNAIIETDIKSITNTNKTITSKDKVFLLSKSEAEQYFPTDASRKCKTTKAAAKAERTITVNRTPYTVSLYDGFQAWWLRDADAQKASQFYTVQSDGSVSSAFSAEVIAFGGVRPVIWVDNTAIGIK